MDNLEIEGARMRTDLHLNAKRLRERTWSSSGRKVRLYDNGRLYSLQEEYEIGVLLGTVPTTTRSATPTRRLPTSPTRRQPPSRLPQSVLDALGRQGNITTW